jgi:hypothetical protein
MENCIKKLDMKIGCVVNWRALLVGSNANNGSNAGISYANSNNAASNTNANIGSQLCLKFFSHKPCLLAKKYVIKSCVGSQKRKLVKDKAK